MKNKREPLYEILYDIKRTVKNNEGTVFEMGGSGLVFKFSDFLHTVGVTEYERINNGGRAPREWECVLLTARESEYEYEVEFGIVNRSRKPEGVHTLARELRVVFFVPKKPH